MWLGQRSGGMGEVGQGCEVVRDAGGAGRVGIMGTNCLLEDRSMKRKGVVEGTEVQDMMIDTDCSRTMLRQDLVLRNKMIVGEDIMVRCAHGDIVRYPLELEVDGVPVTVTAAVSERLPVAALLGTDIPGLVGFLHSDAPADSVSNALVVTRAQAKQLTDTEASQQRKEEQEGVHPNPLLEGDGTQTASPPPHVASLPDDPLPGSIWTDDMFEQPRDRP